jgi:phosphatidylserine/phosphatidylglycerophosphate/cardiolipin synthase-like enzyme
VLIRVFSKAMNHNTRFTIFLLLFCLIFAPVQAASDIYYPAMVKGVCDRAYEAAISELLDSAQESITVSMFIVVSGPWPRHPINRLLSSLERALRRGVEVTIYYNTKDTENNDFSTEEALAPLGKKGARLFAASPLHKLHDKLIIVDSRYVVIGSTNWSTSALRYNFESSVLIDSPGLAQELLERMREIK